MTQLFSFITFFAVLLLTLSTLRLVEASPNITNFENIIVPYAHINNVTSNSRPKTSWPRISITEISWAIKMNESIHKVTSRIGFIYHNLYCPASNITTNETESVNETDSSSQLYDDSQAIQKFSCMTIKVLTVSGISITSGLGVALLLPLVLILIMVAIGFTTYGVIAGSCAACCQSKMGDVEAGGWFASCQSLGALGLMGLYQRPLFLFIWITSSVIVGYLIWGLY